jgi:hypothetical protein
MGISQQLSLGDSGGAPQVSGTFGQWLQASFDHAPPTAAKKQDWYWDEGFASFWDPLCITDAVAVRYMTRLFLEPERLNVYSLEQVAEGIWFLIGGSSPSKSSRALLNPAINLDERVACIHAMTEFFRSFVAPATPGLAETDSDTDCDPFHCACYMWWDILPLRPFRGDPPVGEPELHEASLKAMSETLELQSDVCRTSALHGLNHWQENYRDFVEATIDAFLAHAPEITPHIREYATKARAGLCL